MSDIKTKIRNHIRCCGFTDIQEKVIDQALDKFVVDMVEVRGWIDLKEWFMSTDVDERDTHTAYMTPPKPIEVEKAECDHTFKWEEHRGTYSKMDFKIEDVSKRIKIIEGECPRCNKIIDAVPLGGSDEGN